MYYNYNNFLKIVFSKNYLENCYEYLSIYLFFDKNKKYKVF